MNEYIIGLPQHNKNPVFTVSICGITFPDSNYHITRKNSPVFDIEYVTKGEGIIITNNKKYNVKEGDVYILKQNYDHNYFSDSKNPYEKMWLNAEGNLINHLLSAYNLDDITVINNADISKYLSKIIRVNSKNNISSDEKNRRTAVILHETFAFLNEHISKSKPTINPEAQQMQKYIEDNFSRDINLEELASVIFRSKSQAIRIFKSEFNTTPVEYLIKCRINHAKLLLKNSNLLIKEIAFISGFKEEHYFSDIFKRRVGVSPRQYRNY